MNLIWFHNQWTTYMAEHHGLSDADHPVQVGKSLELLLLVVALDKEL